MSKTITARFDSVDEATIAASNTKDRCENVKGVKIKYKSHKHDDIPYVFPAAYAPSASDISNPSILQNGIFPVAVNVDALGNHSYYDTERRKAIVEITAADNANPSKITSVLRQNGGTSVKVR